MTEPDFPYPKRNFEVKDIITSDTPATFQTSDSPHQNDSKIICPKCKKVFNSNEELNMHMETVHQSPKKKL